MPMTGSSLGLVPNRRISSNSLVKTTFAIGAVLGQIAAEYDVVTQLRVLAILQDLTAWDDRTARLLGLDIVHHRLDAPVFDVSNSPSDRECQVGGDQVSGVVGCLCQDRPIECPHR